MKQASLSSGMVSIRFALRQIVKLRPGFLLIKLSQELITAALPFLNVFMVRAIIEELTNRQRFQNACLYAGIMFVCNFLGREMQTFLGWRGSIGYISLMDQNDEITSKKFMNMDYSCLEQPKVLDKLSNLHSISNVSLTIIENFCRLIASVIGLGMSIAVIATLHPLVVIIIFLLIGITSIVNSRATKKVNQLNISFAPVRRKSEYLRSVTTDISAGKEIRSFSARSFFIDKISESDQKIMEHETRVNTILCKAGLGNGVLNVIQTGGLYAYMTVQFITGAITISDFSMYLGVASNVTMYLSGITNSYLNIASQKDLIEEYYQYFQLPEEMRTIHKDASELPADKFTIEFRNVSFQYPNADRFTLKNINLKIEPGETLSVIGKNGAGKTTLIKLLARLYDPTSGEILINGVNIKKFPYDSYMNFIGPVFQDFVLFPYSIRENLDCNKKHEEEEDLYQALEKCNLSDKIKELPRGLDTYLFKGKGWEESVELSGGESQKLAIARAYLKNSPLVILDEPTAAVDPISEARIYNSFHELTRGKTALYISHRLSSAKFSDRIIFLDGQTIAECGTHQELMRLGKGYAELYQMQARYYQD